MSTCGYICPSCNGTKLTEDGKDCEWCKVDYPVKQESVEEELPTSQDNASE